MKHKIVIKRAYEPGDAGDGYRIYVDRLWPRGLSHENFHYDLWDKEIAPSTALREWFHADPDHRWEEFCRRYISELQQNPAFPTLVSEISDKPTITLLYSSRDHEHNNATVLSKALESEFAKN